MSDLRVDCKAIERSYLYAEEDREVWNVSSVWHRDAKGASKKLTTVDDAGSGVARIVNGVIAVFEAKTMSEERKVCCPCDAESQLFQPLLLLDRFMHHEASTDGPLTHVEETTTISSWCFDCGRCSVCMCCTSVTLDSLVTRVFDA